jgi:hypothetical protein
MCNICDPKPIEIEKATVLSPIAFSDESEGQPKKKQKLDKGGNSRSVSRSPSVKK